MSASSDGRDPETGGDTEAETFKEDEESFSWPVSGIILAVLIFGWALLKVYWGGSSDPGLLEQMGASSGEALRSGEWQRLFIAGWLHSDSGHLEGNLATLFLLTYGLEPVLSAGPVIVICLLGSISGFAYEGWVAPQIHGIGASGGAWALMGTGLGVFLFGRNLGSNSDRQVAIGICGLVLLWECLFLWDTNASLRGHFAGAISGIVTGSIFCGLMQLRAGKAIAGVLAAAALAFAPIAAASLWTTTEPWNYREPGETRTFSATEFQRTVSITAPASLIRYAKKWKNKHGDLRIVVGDPKRNPLTFSLIAWPEPISEYTNKLPTKPVDGKAWREPPTTIAIGGKQFVFIDAEDAKSKSVRFPRWVGNLNGLHVDLQASIAPGASKQWQELGLDAIRSLAVTEAQ